MSKTIVLNILGLIDYTKHYMQKIIHESLCVSQAVTCIVSISLSVSLKVEILVNVTSFNSNGWMASVVEAVNTTYGMAHSIIHRIHTWRETEKERGISSPTTQVQN